MTEQAVESKDFRGQTKEWMAVFFTNRVRNIIEKAASCMCVIIPQNRKVKKKFNFTLTIKVSSTTVWG